MNADQGRPMGRDPDTRKGIAKALSRAFGLEPVPPLIVDAAADAAFVLSIEALRGVPGQRETGK